MTSIKLLHVSALRGAILRESSRTREYIVRYLLNDVN